MMFCGEVTVPSSSFEADFQRGGEPNTRLGDAGIIKCPSSTDRASALRVRLRELPHRGLVGPWRRIEGVMAKLQIGV